MTEPVREGPRQTSAAELTTARVRAGVTALGSHAGDWPGMWLIVLAYAAIAAGTYVVHDGHLIALLGAAVIGVAWYALPPTRTWEEALRRSRGTAPNDAGPQDARSQGARSQDESHDEERAGTDG